MARRVNLDAMIPREDFSREGNEFDLDLFRDFPISNLDDKSPIQKLLRKPDFQRETNHWTPSQIATFIASFLDNEVIPSLILWKSSTYIFVIDGGHRLSALRAWVENDYGDGPISQRLYGGKITQDQKRIAQRTRQQIENTIGRYQDLRSINVENSKDDPRTRRARRLFTRAINLQWIQGNASVAETSFYKINSQGTPLDDTEESLIRNRKKPIAISARAILRAGSGHKYWSSFDPEAQIKIEELSQKFFRTLFEPEIDNPLKTLDVPLGGSTSPLDALSLLIEFMEIAGSKDAKPDGLSKQADDINGEGTITNLERSLLVLDRITGNSAGSLGLHPAVYFYNERGKYSRFLFLGMALLIKERVSNNDGGFFAKFTRARKNIEEYLIENKSLVGIVLQNLAKSQRIPRMRDLLYFLVNEHSQGRIATVENMISHLGMRGRIFDVTVKPTSASFSDDAKSAVFIRTAIDTSMRCPICSGLLDPRKSVSYDHITRVRDGGLGEAENGQLVHPYCNTGVKN